MDIYKCEVCGNITDLIYNGGGVLVCCGQDMVKLVANVEEETYDKHIPVVSEKKKQIKVEVGEKAHPMDKNHYIEWIAMVVEKGVIRRCFKPGEKAKMTFSKIADDYEILVYCNVHGLYKNK